MKISQLLLPLFLLVSFVKLSSQSCFDAIELKGDTILKDTFGYVGSLGIDCYQQNNLTSGRWYKIKGNDEIFEIKALSETVFVLEGDCNSYSCINSNSNKYLLTKGKNYFIVQGHPSYDLQVKAHGTLIRKIQKLPYQLCITSEILDCGKTITIPVDDIFSDKTNNCRSYDIPTIWFKVVSTGSKFSLNIDGAEYSSINIVEGEECEKYDCSGFLNFQKNFYFTLNKGNAYLVAIQPMQFTKELLSITLNCEDAIENNSCESAELLKCNEFKFVAKGEDESEYYLASDQFVKGKWYQLEQKDSSYRLKFNLPFNPGYNTLRIFESTSEFPCKNLEFKSEFPLLTGIDFVVETHQNKKTFLVFDITDNQELAVNCTQNNMACKGAKDITDGLEEIITKNLNLEPFVDEDQRIYNFDHWYKVTRDNLTIEMELQHEVVFTSASMDFALIEGNCDQLKIIKRFEYTELANRKLLLSDLALTDGKSYYIAAGMKDMYNQVKLKFTYQSKYEPGSKCDNAIELTPNKRQRSANPKAIFISDFKIGPSLYIEPSIWCKIKGNGNVYNIHFDKNFFKKILVIQGSCATELVVINTGANKNNLEHISFEAEAGVEYFILCEPLFSQGVEDYLLPFVTTSNAVMNSTCAGALEISCGIPLEQTNEGAFISKSPVCDVVSSTFWYKIEPAETRINWLKYIDQTNFNVRAYKGTCGNLECLPLQINQTAINIDESADYYLSISPEVPLNAVFKFGLDCSQPLSGGKDCNLALEIECNEKYFIDFSQGSFSSKSDFTIFNEFWLKVKGDGNLKNFTLKNFFTFSYFVYDNCDSLLFSKENFLSSSDILRNNFSILIPDGKEYKIKLVGLDYFAGELELTCVTPVENYSCDQAKPLKCGDNFDFSLSENQPNIAPYAFQKWYSLPSQSGIVKLTSQNPQFGAEYRIFKGRTCDDKELVDANSLYNAVYGLLDDTSANYYMVLFSGGYLFDDTLKLKIDCSEFGNNETCYKATEISCGKNYNFSPTSPSNMSSFYPCSDNNSGGWMKIVGDGKTYKLELSYPNSEFGEMTIFIGEGLCDTFNCINQFDLGPYRRYAYFETKSGKTYYLKSKILNGYGQQNFKVDCYEPSNNYSASNAKTLKCDDEILGLINFFERDSTFDDFLGYRSGLFYRLPDLNKIVKFIFPKLNQNYHLVFYKIIQNQLIYDTRVSVNSEVNFFEIISKGNDYIFKIVTENEKVPVYFKTICNKIPENLTCEKAKELNCMDEFSQQLHNPLNHLESEPCGSFSNSLTFWYKLPLSEVSKININSESFTARIVQGTCGDITCLKSTTDYRTPLSVANFDSSQIFMILHSTSYIDTSILSGSISCTKILDNVECKKRKDYQCGDTLILDMSLAYQKEITGPNRCVPYEKNGFYYTFNGDGRVWNFLNDTTAQEQYSIMLLEKDTCQLTKCVSFTTFYPQIENVPFIAKKDSIYTLFVSYNGSHPPVIKLITECLETIRTAICATTNDLVVNDTTFVIKNKAALKVYDGKNVFEATGQWFSIRGTNKAYKIINIGGASAIFRLYKDSCSLNNCIATGLVDQWQDYKFIASSGQRYILYLQSSTNEFDSTKLRITNYFIPENDLCDGAELISCGQNIQVKANTYSPDIYYTCSGINSGWYKFILAETKTMSINFGQQNVESIAIHETCNKTCFSYLNAPDDIEKGNMVFEFQGGVEYYLSINWSTDINFKDFILNFECLPTLENIKPSRATNLGCEPVRINSEVKLKIYTESCKYCFNPSSLWYKFVGTGQNVSILYNQIYVGLELFDKELNSLGNLRWSDNDFTTILNEVYYLKVDFPPGYSFKDFTLAVENLCSTKTFENKIQEISFYPNPTSSILYFEVPDNNNIIKIQIFSLTGQLVNSFTKRAGTKLDQLDVTDYESGLYFVKFDFDHVQKIGKFIKI